MQNSITRNNVRNGALFFFIPFVGRRDVKHSKHKKIQRGTLAAITRRKEKFMNREGLKALGLTDEQINGIMEDYGKDMAKLQRSVDAKDSELKKYQKGGELYSDTAEFERLKTFEKDTLTKEANAKKTAALTKLFKSANASDSVAKLFVSGKDLDKIELDDKGEIKGGADILKQAKADYADLFGESGNGGVPQGTNAQTGGGTAKKTPMIF